MSSIKIALVIIVSLLGAVYIGIGAASDQQQTIGILLGAVAVATCLLLGKRIWMLIPLMFYVNLTLYLPGRPSTLLLAQFLVVVFGLLMIFSGKLRAKFSMTALEWCILLLVFSVLQVYARNPVGVSLFGASSVGGRPYILFGASLMTAIILGSIKVPYSDLKKIFRLAVIGGVTNFILSALGYFLPFFGQYIGTGTVESKYSLTAVDTGRAGRLDFLVNLGPNIALWISSLMNPLRAAFKFLWLPLIMVAFASAGLSGYRNVIASTGLTFLVGIMYYGGIRSLFMSAGIGAVVLAAVSVVNVSNPLPPNIQRAMSFLPGTWDQEFVDAAEESTEWRVEIWEEVLFTENWIKNKILGDGLGFTAEELAYQEELKLLGSGMGLSGFDTHRESILVNGDYHSGPISAVRTVGYLGLVVMLVCMIMISIRAHRLIIRSQGRPWLPVVMIVCIPLIWYPVFFLFIFGSFGKDANLILMGYAMVRLLENNLPWNADGELQNNSISI